ncbi:hypothetical protein ABZY16_31030 [Streptomyces sp. NPDC006553]|uniref:DUF7848 domain-containing protein n=1 Tax=unclassified Streptomyces TaxID=2593676 RepID=UPI002258B271|nr:hypothetical protein [Streptomyces sp. NBC_00233]MCX5226736.1 hypothetical protein [Streptomyces sp. NBC_00233]
MSAAGAHHRTARRPRLWALRPDRTGSGTTTEAECTTCLDGSGAADDGRGPAVWCLSHAQATGHTGFRRIRTDFFRASWDGPAPGAGAGVGVGVGG